MTSDLHHLAAAFALDALEPEERRAFEEHYPDCDMCSQEVADFREAAAHLGAAIEQAPPAGLRDRVLAEIGETRQMAPVVGAEVVSIDRRWARPSVLLTAVAAALVLVAGFALALRPDGSASEFEQVFSAPDAVLAQLDGDDGEVQVLWSASLDKAVVFANGLDDLPDEQAYALWFVTDDGVAPAGLFDADGGSVRAELALDDIDATGWGITVEPASGSPQPTSDIIYSVEF